MADFDAAVGYVLEKEGVLSENPNDLGGITKYGISLRFLRALSPEKLKQYGIFPFIVDEQTIRELTINQAKAVYCGEFWEAAPFESINSQEIANYLFDMAVNMGISPAIKAIQRACWAVTKDWKGLEEDGILGQETLDVIRLCTFLIMPALRAERAAIYRDIVEHNQTQREFLTPWYNRTYTSSIYPEK